MSLYPASFGGDKMTAETYDDAVALRAYVLRYFKHLMTPLERRVIEYSTPIVSRPEKSKNKAEHSKIIKLHQFLEERDGHVDDADVIDAFQIPYEARVASAVDRVLQTRRDDVFENRCSACHRLVRTPMAKQCLWCGHDWH